MLRVLSIVLVILWTAACSVAQPAQAPRTPAEAGAETTLAQVNAFLDELDLASERVTIVEIGTTAAGERIPAVIVSAEPIATARQRAKADKPLVVAPASGAAETDHLLALARDLALAEEPGPLDSLIVAVLPVAVDGADWLAAEHAPTRAALRFVTDWDATAVLAGAGWPADPGVDGDLTSFVRETLSPALGVGAAASGGLRSPVNLFALAGRVAIGAPATSESLAALGAKAADIAKATSAARKRAADGEWDTITLPGAEANRPSAYLLGADAEATAHALQRHGVAVGVLREDVTVDIAGGATALAPGRLVVSTEQGAGRLAARLLDGGAPDSPIAGAARIEEDAHLLTRPARKPPEQRETGKRITVDMLYGDDADDDALNFRGSPVRVRSWIDDEHYVVVKDGALVKVEATTGRAAIFGAETDEIEARLAESPFITDEDAEGIAERNFATPDPEHPGVLFTHADDLFFANFDGTGLRRLTSTPEPEELPTFSPDGRTVAFVRENNLFVLDLETASERAITTEGTNERRFGKNAWVYFEEVFGRSWQAHWWSPDSEHIIFLESDESLVPVFTIIDDEPDEQVIEAIHYPKVGQTNPSVRVHIAGRAGSPVREVDLSGYGDFIVKHLGWSPDGKQARVQIQDRAQTWLDYATVGVRAGKPKVLFRETTGAWVDSPEDAFDLPDGSFLLFSERDGWKHLYRFDKGGKLMTQVTSGEYEVRAVHHIDDDITDNSGWIYFTGTSPDNHIAEHLVRVRLDGAGLERLTSERGHHSVELSPDATMFVDSWSSAEQPTRVALRTIDGELVRWIDTNPVYELEEFDLTPVQLVQIESDAGPMLEASLLLPPDFDPSKKHPIWFQTYGGPHAPTVRDAWSGAARDYLLTHMGIVVFRGDPYPASGKGAVSAWAAYKQLGVRELADITDLVEWVTAYDWADASRVGMQGHSYGGFMTSYAMTHSKLFSAGIAGAPVTSWRDYDTIYTERYMHTPQENPEGYEGTSVVNAAPDLHGRLLLAHGTMDDNVHMQNSIRLIGALHDAEKPFDLMVYPGSRHGIRSGHYGPYQIEFIERWMVGE